MQTTVHMPVIGLPADLLRELEVEAGSLSTTPSGIIEALVSAYLGARRTDWRRSQADVQARAARSSGGRGRP